MNEKNLKDLVEKQIDNFLYAGEVALDLRNKGLNKEIKSDGTPVSNGDLEVNRIITKKILELTPDLPIVSEETSHNKLTKNLTNFWLVDPIDGTYDYINNLDEFTINWAGMCAIAVVMIIPALILTFIVQKHLVSGLTFGGVKG